MSTNWRAIAAEDELQALKKRVAELECQKNACQQVISERDARISELADLLRSAHCIAARKGVDTAWDTFAASIQKLEIGSVTARVYKVPREEATK